MPYEASKKLLRACSCGNFTLWPGSHAKVYHDFVTSQVGPTTRKGIAEFWHPAKLRQGRQGHAAASLPPGRDDHTSPGGLTPPPEDGAEPPEPNRPEWLTRQHERHMDEIRRDVVPVNMTACCRGGTPVDWTGCVFTLPVLVFTPICRWRWRGARETSCCGTREW